MEIKEPIFKAFPDEIILVNGSKKSLPAATPQVNGHIHTPHSYSAFSSIDLAFQMARYEGITVLGINDFYTTDGYEEFAELALKFKVFPLFNIEFMGLQSDLQNAGVRVNDPNNPGRTYLSGKGLAHPVIMGEQSAAMIHNLQMESNRQTYQMVEKLNVFFAKNGIDFHFNAEELHQKLAKGLFRERHLAQAIRMAVFEKEATPDGRKQWFDLIFSGKPMKSPLGRIASVENEIRSRLLKAGGAAFVPEDPSAFLSLEEIREIIIDSGGIPCYPLLLDDPQGNITEFESTPEKLMQELIRNHIYCIELIPSRNRFDALKEYVTYFNNNGFVVTFGTEHNTPLLEPLKVSCSGGYPLDDELLNINYEGAAIIAAHQYLIARGEAGYLSGRIAKIDQRQRFVTLGKAVIDYFRMLP